MNESKVTYSYILLTFLKIGATTFGGYMSLVTMVQRQVCEIDRKLPEEELLDAISLASVLPGPIAFNVVVYVGYKLRGYIGAVIAFIAILVPAFLLILLFSFCYFNYGQTPIVRKVFEMILPVVTGLILAVGYNMGKKQITSWAQGTVMIISCVTIIFITGYVTILCVIIAGGTWGWLYFRPKKQPVISDSIKRHQANSLIITSISIVAMLFFFIIGLHFIENKSVPVQLASIFSGMSLTLFGGGYVVIPTLHEMFVENLHWLTSTEFADGIAITQMTPGPIFISAAFIGYKVWGIYGACISTLSFFIPPAILMILCSRFLEFLKGSKDINAIFKGIRPAVIGMIFASVPALGQTISFSWISLLLFLSAVFLTIRFKLSPIYMIIAAGIIGLILSIYE
ncbi:chromate efflux transporter [Parabacteroides sp. Marseille-P3160]|uniref:chromate efflux transporter n=1 Tax=Parabacteroides sp. Marseille-P3160 TaxID=1917887 RepID=UPI0009BA16FE|nr:chromate efflux transporter [Parabacteroides sp. Marseille-P3160]